MKYIYGCKLITFYGERNLEMWWPKENQLQNIVLNQERTLRKFKGRMADNAYFPC